MNLIAFLSILMLGCFLPRDHQRRALIWSADGTKINGTTQAGRATCDRLDMNDERYKGEHPIGEARLLWVKAGWHPPPNDPRELNA